MSLRVWNLLQDPYNHTQLADNWMRVDQHDHTSGRGVQIPTEGIADGAITGAKLAPGSLAIPDNSITDIKLASPNNGVWRTVFTGNGYIGPGVTVSNNIFGADGVRIAVSGGTSGSPLQAIYLNPADFAVAGLATKVRVLGTSLANAVGPDTAFVYALRPVTAVTGSSGTVVGYTLGTTLVFASQGGVPLLANTITTATSPEATLTSAVYTVDVQNSINTTAANSSTVHTFSVQIRNV